QFISYPANNLKKLAAQPENINCNWDILNKERFAEPLLDWIHSILESKINPVDNERLNEEDLEKLQNHTNYIFDAFEHLKLSRENQLHNLF
ncbi:hypothetical protein, partial [uncultured Legionella sp.]|uniref:hypothetical protein n=1 Tax=uncultured Legionella sp. TaxID=210934 RepID=UPI002601D1D8